MQYQNYQYYNQQQYPPQPQQFNPQYRPPYQPPQPVDPQKLKKQYETRLLRKKSSGLGFYVLAYFLSMNCIVAGLVIFAEISLMLSGDINSFDVESFTSSMMSGPFYHYMSILAAVVSAVVPALIYLKSSKTHISDCIQVNSVKPTMLIAMTAMGMGLAMVANIAADLVTQNFSSLGFEYNLNMDSSSSSVFTNILYVISTAVTPAFAEEFAFRGILMGTLRKYGNSFAIITSAIMFGAMHGNIIQIPFAFILGLIFGYIDCKANSIIPSIIIHFVNNFYSVIMDIMQSQSVVTKHTFYIIYYSLFVAMLVLGVLAFLYIMKKDKNFLSISDTSNIVSLPLKEKISSFFTSAGVIVVVSIFIIETIGTLFIL